MKFCLERKLSVFLHQIRIAWNVILTPEQKRICCSYPPFIQTYKPVSIRWLLFWAFCPFSGLEILEICLSRNGSKKVFFSIHLKTSISIAFKWKREQCNMQFVKSCIYCAIFAYANKNALWAPHVRPSIPPSIFFSIPPSIFFLFLHFSIPLSIRKSVLFNHWKVLTLIWRVGTL